jgi:hypothetical protein
MSGTLFGFSKSGSAAEARRAGPVMTWLMGNQARGRRSESSFLGLRSKIVVNQSNDVRRWSEASGLFANPVERGSVQEFLDLAPDMLNDLVRW